MVCMYCDGKTKVTNSRGSQKSQSTWRRRECRLCHTVFTTRETVDLEGAIRVKKTTGRLEPFERDKLYISVYDSLSHRKTAQKDATELTDTIVRQLLLVHSHGVIEVTSLTRAANEVLDRFDKAAGMHYQVRHPG